MTLPQLRRKLADLEHKRRRAHRHYKAAKQGSASAKYWLAKRKAYWREQVKIRKAIKRLRPTAAERVVAVAEMCAANYRRRPAAYHYLAGGVPNTVIDRPTPFHWRSDCSQFAVNVYRMAGLRCPGSGTFLRSNTATVATGGTIVRSPRAGDFKMWAYDPRRPRSTTHHMEVVIDSRGTTIGHGTRAIDKLAPGGYFYYLRFIN